MARTVKEWIGRNDDSRAPDRVRDRVFERAGRVCHICQHPIKVPAETWDLDHVVALINGGENREANLAPAHKHCHVGKTALDVKEKAKVAKVRQKHNGSKQPSSSLSARKKPSTPKPLTKQLPPRVVDVFGRRLDSVERKAITGSRRGAV